MRLFTPDELPEVFSGLIEERGVGRVQLADKAHLNRDTIVAIETGSHSSRMATVEDAFRALGYDLHLVAVEVDAPRPEFISKDTLNRVISLLSVLRDTLGPMDDDGAMAADTLDLLGAKDSYFRGGNKQ